MSEFNERKKKIILGLEEPKTIMEFLYAFPGIPPMIPINLELLQKRVNEQSEWERKFRKMLDEAKRGCPLLSECHPDNIKALRELKEKDMLNSHAEAVLWFYDWFCESLSDK